MTVDSSGEKRANWGANAVVQIVDEYPRFTANI